MVGKPLVATGMSLPLWYRRLLYGTYYAVARFGGSEENAFGALWAWGAIFGANVVTITFLIYTVFDWPFGYAAMAPISAVTLPAMIASQFHLDAWVRGGGPSRDSEEKKSRLRRRAFIYALVSFVLPPVTFSSLT
jgi:hypothetical protein